MPETLHFLTEKLRKVSAQLPFLPGALQLVWQSAPRWTAAWSALLLAQGLLPVATVYLTRLLVDSLVAVIREGGTDPALRPALFYGALMALVWLTTECLGGLIRWIRTAQSDLIQDHVTNMIHQKSAAADMAFYESADFYDHLHRARDEAGYRPLALLDSLGNMLQSAVTLAAMAAVLVPYGWWLPLALIVSTIPAFFVVMRFAVRQHEWRHDSTEDERRSWYYDWLLTSGETAAELRLFGLAPGFHKAFQSIRARLRGEKRNLARDQSVAEASAGLLALAVTATVMLWMVWRAAQGLATMGDLALFYQAFQQGLRLMRALLENAGLLYGNLLFLGNLFEFLALEPRIMEPSDAVAPPITLQHGIRFRNVTFRYPGSEHDALHHLDLFVPAGRIAAVVGPNGAGKSTLLKLLCRFYDPTQGTIEIDGIDLRQMRTEELRRRITVLFQQPVQYNATARENISLGDPECQPDPCEIQRAAKAAGADDPIEHLPEGYDTLLGKWFVGGTQLSTGEWQRVALARAFLRKAPILILDEPTSSMDPWAEAAWLDRFRTLAAGRTAILITHRFTTARLADLIFVVDRGSLQDSGTHEELVSHAGLYASWWEAQR